MHKLTVGVGNEKNQKRGPVLSLAKAFLEEQDLALLSPHGLRASNGQPREQHLSQQNEAWPRRLLRPCTGHFQTWDLCFQLLSQRRYQSLTQAAVKLVKLKHLDKPYK